MNDFDKIFSEKLYNHKTPPPTNGWAQLNAALDRENKAKKKIIYWRVAAVIALLLLAGIAWWGIDEDLQKVPVGEQMQIPAEEPALLELQMDKEPKSLALKEELAPTDLDEKQESIPEKSEKANAQHTNEEKNIRTKNKEQTQNEKSDLTLASIEVSDSLKVQPIENIQPVETLAVEPLAIAESELLALESVKARVSPAVTIIYKPGNVGSENLEINDEKSIAMELLNDIKNSNISFSDIRNAKAELLAKVFSKKENEVTP